MAADNNHLLYFIDVYLWTRALALAGKVAGSPFAFVRITQWMNALAAYNLCNLWRRLALPARVATWSLTSLQQRMVKIGGRLIKHARCCLLLAGGLTRRLLAGMRRRIALLPSPSG
jgi:hypothetical protein